MDRRTVLELTIAGGLTAIGIVTGNPAVLTGLVSVAGSVGANWAADLVQAGYRHWCDHWFTSAGRDLTARPRPGVEWPRTVITAGSRHHRLFPSRLFAYKDPQP